MSVDPPIPDFLGDEWLFNSGWSFGQHPDGRLDDAVGLRSSDPWARFLSVLACAQRGNFAHVGVLGELLQEKLPHPLDLATMHMAAAVGGNPELAKLERWLFSDWFTQAAGALAWSGKLSMIEPLLARRKQGGTEVRTTMDGAISYMLEPTPAGLYESLGASDDAYETRVRARVVELASSHAESFLLGEPMHPSSLVRAIREIARFADERLWESSARLSTHLFHLQTLTGISMFGIVVTDQEGVDMVDRAALNRFLDRLDQVNWSQYSRGVRTFFGHRC